MKQPVCSVASRYVAAVFLVAGACALNLLLTRRIEPSAAPLLFAAVLLAAWQGGWGPGLLASVSAALAEDYFFLSPLHSLDFKLSVIVRLSVFLLVSLLTSYLTAQRKLALEEREQSLLAERRARAEAEEANRLKDRFLAVTSHELRTPLSAILLWTDVLETEQLPASARECIVAIRNGGNAISQLVEDLLDVARMSAGKLRLHLRPVQASEPVRLALDAARPAAAAREIELRADLDPSIGPINADPQRLQQIAANLVTNAIKFTPTGGRVEIHLRQIGSTVRLQVSDTGRGISARDLPHVFERFWQSSAPSHEGSRGGLGLGLSIVRDLARLHGGTVRAESPGQGRGATFTVEFPILIENQQPTPPDEKQSIPPSPDNELNAIAKP